LYLTSKKDTIEPMGVVKVGKKLPFNEMARNKIQLYIFTLKTNGNEKNLLYCLL
jgi:hypothetical protein